MTSRVSSANTSLRFGIDLEGMERRLRARFIGAFRSIFSPVHQVLTTSNIGETLWFRHGLTATTIRIPGYPVGGYDGGIDKILRGWYWVESPSWGSFYHVWEVKSRVSKRLD